MKAFAELYAELDATTSSNAKLAAMQVYFAQAAPEDAAWAVYFLSGGRPRQLVPVRILRELAVEVSGLEPWLFEESYQAVGDQHAGRGQDAALRIHGDHASALDERGHDERRNESY